LSSVIVASVFLETSVKPMLGFLQTFCFDRKFKNHRLGKEKWA